MSDQSYTIEIQIAAKPESVYQAITNEVDKWWNIVKYETGSKVIFTHQGLVPELECFDVCQTGWDYFLGSLKDYLETGKGNPFEEETAE